MIYLLTFLYTVVCIFLILVVLLQTGKRADLAGAFGGGGSQTAFGARGAATLLTKLTTISAVLFMVLALGLALLQSRRAVDSGTVLDSVGTPAAPTVPAPEEGAGEGSGLPGLADVTGEEPATEDPSPAPADATGDDGGTQP